MLITQALQQKFDHPGFHSSLYEIAFINGDTSGMQQQLDWASGKPYEYIAFDWQAGAAAFAGQWRKAQELSRRAIDLAARGDTKEVAAGYASEQALRLAVLSSNFSLPSSEKRKLKLEVEKLVQSALNLARGRASLPRVALALALCGQTEQAKPLVDELTKRYPEDTIINSIWLPVIRAVIELQRGNAAGTIEQLQTAVSLRSCRRILASVPARAGLFEAEAGHGSRHGISKDSRSPRPGSAVGVVSVGASRIGTRSALAGDLAKSRTCL